VPENGVGYVTRFEVRKSFMDRYEIHRGGGNDHAEWWIPAEDLNANIVGLIEVVEENSRYSVLKLRLAVS